MNKASLLDPRRSRLASFFRAGFFAYTTAVVLIGAGAYAGVLPAVLATFPHYDKVMHFILIGGVAFFLDGALHQRPLWRGHGSLAGALVLVVAGVDEWAQRFSPRRSSTWSDFVADVAGVVVLVWLSRKLSRARERAR